MAAFRKMYRHQDLWYYNIKEKRKNKARLPGEAGRRAGLASFSEVSVRQTLARPYNLAMLQNF
jgi:hypothetical protein